MQRGLVFFFRLRYVENFDFKMYVFVLYFSQEEVEIQG